MKESQTPDVHRRVIVSAFKFTAIILMITSLLIASISKKGLFLFNVEFSKGSMLFLVGVFFLLFSFLIRMYDKKSYEKGWIRKIDIYKQLSKKELWLFAAAVFCMFGTMGPIGILQASIYRPISIVHVFIMTFLSGGLAAVVILFANDKRKLILFLSLFIIGRYFHNEIETFITGQDFQIHQNRVESVTLTAGELSRVESERSNLGLFVVGLIVAGYFLFIYVISKEGQKRVRLQTEVDVARRIQESLNYAKNGEVKGVHIESITLPAAEVGGDYVDCFIINRDEFLILIADASGHGVGSGIYAAMAKSAIKCMLLINADIVYMLSNLNKTLYQISTKDKFLTAAFVKINVAKKTIEAATAGHYPILFKHNEELIQLRTPSLGLGINPNSEYASLVMSYNPDDRLLLYTDGIVEASKKGGSVYGLDTISVEFYNVQEHKNGFTEKLLDSAREHCCGEEFSDDISMIHVILK